jgi:hypothetical protein
MRRFIAWTLSWCAVAGLIGQIPTPALAQNPIVTVDQCRNLSDTEVRDRIRELAATGLKAELAKLNYVGLVNIYWAKTDVNTPLDREIDEAVAAVRANSSWFDRAYSTVSPSSAQRYATAVADKAYNSEGFKSALEEMATAIAKDAGAQIEQATTRVASPVIACVQTALQSRYGNAVAQVFVQDSQKSIEASGDTPPARIGSSDLIVNNAASISGIILIVTRRVIGKVVQSVGRRIAGMVVSRIASAVAGIVGLVLIAKDLYEAGDGVFPIIAERMKSEETKKLIKDEISKSIETEISQQVDTIAQETAERIYAVWLDFKQRYNRLLSFSEKSPAFAEYLKERRFEQLNKLGQIVDILYASEDEARIFKRVADGSINRALIDLPDAGVTIAAELKSLDKAFQWNALAGRDLPRVAELHVYRWLPLEGLSPQNLQKVLSLKDRIAMARLASLEPAARDLILNLPVEQVHVFARKLTDQELAAFAEYQRLLGPAAARRLTRAAGENPRIMQELSGNGVRQAIVNSRNQLAALDMILHDDTALIGYGRILKDVSLVRDGAVEYRVFWERYWQFLLLGGFILLLVLSWLRRLIFGRRQVFVVQQPHRTPKS